MTDADLSAWLGRYGRAWEARDADRFAALFSPDVRYHWTPFDEPQAGRGAVADAFRNAVQRQEDILFDATILSFQERTGIARWRCSFRRPGATSRVRLDGIFLMEFDDAGLCATFREWWHSDE